MNKKKLKKKLKKLKEISINSLIYNAYYHKKIDENLVYVESRDGKDFAGNILRIVEELSTGKYGDYKIVVYAKENVHPKIKELQKNYSLKIDKVIAKESVATMNMEQAKYIISDSGLRPKFVKRPGQIVFDTWHGTPLKTMGRDNIAEQYRVANIQQVFLACDYLLYPNDYMKDKMLNAFMMEKIFPGKVLLEGYPRNSVFLKPEEGEKLKDKLGYSSKQLFAYMPTFKGILMQRKDEAQKNIVHDYLIDIDSKLNDDQILFVKLHVFNKQNIDFSEFKHIKEFPEGYEVYDVLNMTDCLITDYSSVFFDYANSGKKIILFNYDEEEYMKDRGTYFPLSELPFPKVQTVDDLIAELNSPISYDDGEFVEKYCTYENVNAVENICSHIFANKKACREESVQNGKKNVLIFAGGLLNNGITSAMLNVLNNIDTSQHNYFISYRSWDGFIKKNHKDIFNRIPEGIEFLPLRSRKNPTLKEKRDYYQFLKNKDKNTKLPKSVENLFKRELTRAYSDFPFDSVINYNGYGRNEILLFAMAENNTIWVHSHMLNEIKSRNKQNFNVLHNAYQKYSNVAVVSPGLVEPTSEISGTKDNIRVIHNFNNYKGIESRADEEISFDDNTILTTNNVDGLKGVLNSPGKKFITVGRFSPEKSHDRLIKAFDKFCDDYPDTQLIIIGSHGNSYNSTKKLAEKSKHFSNITLIKWVSNPMPILKECDLFILSSFYEGWPIVVMEADVLNVPVIATDMVGSTWMKEYGGHVVDNSIEGIKQGMYDFMEGKVNTTLNMNYDEYNDNAIQEFFDLI